MQPGDQFPDFSLPDQDGRQWTNADLLGSPAIIYFYPKDDTTGCTVEACEFRDRFQIIAGARLIGVSPDSAASHRKFIARHGLNFTLLADTDKTLATACGIWVEKTLYGRKYMGVDRTTYLLDANGKITRVWTKVKPQGHASEVAHALAQLINPV